jgi:phosphoribosylformylglycinamidine (FGAM) synthase PurS component
MMPYRIEITLKEELSDAEGQSLRNKAKNYFGIDLDDVRTVQIVTVDADLSKAQVETARNEIFTNPVTQVSSFDPLPVDFDWILWVGFDPVFGIILARPRTEAIEDLLSIQFADGEAVYTSKRYCLKVQGLSRKDAETLSSELLANDIIQQWAVYGKTDWDPNPGSALLSPK